MKKAVVLLSGGLDSAVTLAIARRDGYQCFALSVDYGQRHRAELTAAANIARSLGAHEHRLARLDLSMFGGSALTDPAIAVPSASEKSAAAGIPLTYVPARNTIFLSLALAWAEVLHSEAIFIGANAIDYSGYPDCRPEFIAAFQAMAKLATKAAVEGCPTIIYTPLIALTKAQIVLQGLALGVDFSETVSCYQADLRGLACGICDACRLRRAGFAAAAIADPTRYIVSLVE
ncbi:MAG: 7-cyano-7-deazaguanine synthase QueC [Pseudomonadota bacterium]|nr:7-cyano-7-deazaguanine synthase QueC [Burkholderiales bacterium]MDQ3196444.1 7-cyano-7-deazaguanine synthase QueC [Pseudomonadota bacterium]